MGASAEGAEITTFFAPPSMCACAFSSVVIPVHSATTSVPKSPQPISAGLRSAEILIRCPSTIKSPPSTSYNRISCTDRILVNKRDDQRRGGRSLYNSSIFLLHGRAKDHSSNSSKPVNSNFD